MLLVLYDLEKDPEQMNNIIADPQYANIVTRLKEDLKGLMVKYENNKSLADYRKITDTDFGSIVDVKDDETSVRDVLTK